MPGKERPPGVRAQAVGIALVAGVPEAARQTGISERSIRRWEMSPEMAELAARTKEQVDQEWWAGVQMGFRAVISGFDGPDSLQQKATSAAILFDKWALMRGEATTRTETRSLTDDLDDHESEIFGEVVRAELARRKDGDAASPAVAGDASQGAETPAR